MNKEERKKICVCGHSKGFHFFGESSKREKPRLRECIDNYARPIRCNCKNFELSK